jgi:hypothetical protein
MILRLSWQGVAQNHFLIHVYFRKGRHAGQGAPEQPQSRTKFYAAVPPEREAIGKSMDRAATANIGAWHLIF